MRAATVVAWALLSVLLDACATHAVRCEGELQPINSPAQTATGRDEVADLGTP